MVTSFISVSRFSLEPWRAPLCSRGWDYGVGVHVVARQALHLLLDVAGGGAVVDDLHADASVEVGVSGDYHPDSFLH